MSMRNRNPLQLNSKSRGPRYVYDRPRARLVSNILRFALLLLVLACVGLLLVPRLLNIQFSLPTVPGVPRVATTTPTATDSPTIAPSATTAPSATLGPTNTPTVQPTKQYTVVEGDSLFSIALENGLTIQQLAAANGKQSDTLAIGEVLIIPPSDYELPTATPLPAGLEAGAKLEHVITPGETLAEIAQAYLSTVDAIVSDNKDILTDPDHPPAGVTIVVRYGLVTPTSPAPAASDTPTS
jgi:LysM repeat protein